MRYKCRLTSIMCYCHLRRKMKTSSFSDLGLLPYLSITKVHKPSNCVAEWRRESSNTSGLLKDYTVTQMSSITESSNIASTTRDNSVILELVPQQIRERLENERDAYRFVASTKRFRSPDFWTSWTGRWLLHPDFRTHRGQHHGSCTRRT